MKTKTREEERRDSALLIILILLFGFICIILASGWAIRFAPSWRLNTNMGSKLNPNSDFLTSRPVSFVEPLDPAILTNPAWINVFLTPGASFPTRTPSPAIATSVSPKTSTPIPTLIVPATNTLIVNPTNTLLYFPPPATATPKPVASNIPILTPTASNTPIPSADLQITKTDGVAIYTPGTSVTYSIVVTNSGPSNAINATVTDILSAQIASANWTCIATGSATCTNNGSGNINDIVNIPIGGSLTYTVTANIASSATGNLANTANINVPAGYMDTNLGNNSATDTDAQFIPSADLQITKTDNSTEYIAGGPNTYVIVVSNTGPANVTGATVTDTFSTNTNIDFASVTWTCSTTGSATCTVGPVSGNLNDTVNIPVGSTLTYTITANTIASPSGSLLNTATVTAPSGVTDPNINNNSATDIDQPSGIGTAPDGNVYLLTSGTAQTLNITTVVNGHAGWDLVYYERAAGSGVFLDWIIVQVGDGTNWYTVFNWGDELPDTNTNMDFTKLLPPILSAPPPPQEPDERDIQASDLYNGTGIGINLDGIVPPGTYPYVRFIAPLGDVDGHTEIDAVQTLP